MGNSGVSPSAGVFVAFGPAAQPAINMSNARLPTILYIIDCLNFTRLFSGPGFAYGSNKKDLTFNGQVPKSNASQAKRKLQDAKSLVQIGPNT